MVEKRVKRFGQGPPPPLFGQCPKEIDFSYGRCSLTLSLLNQSTFKARDLPKLHFPIQSHLKRKPWFIAVHIVHCRRVALHLQPRSVWPHSWLGKPHRHLLVDHTLHHGTVTMRMAKMIIAFYLNPSRCCVVCAGFGSPATLRFDQSPSCLPLTLMIMCCTTNEGCLVSV